MARRAFFWLGLIVLWPLAAAASTLERDSLLLSGGTGQQRIFLSSRYVIFNSERVSWNGQVLYRDQHYTLDYASNELLLARPLAESDTLKIVFTRLNLPLAPSLQYLEPARPHGADSLQPRSDLWPKEAPEPKAVFEEGLRLGGSKSLAVRVGSGREAAVEQSLQVSIDGRLARELEINAYLSDQEMPLSAAGSTQELEQLDRVYLEAKAPGWGVIMGDYDLRLEGFQFLRVERQVKGISGRANLRGFEARAATSLSQGRRGQRSFSGLDGIQGPYPLDAGSMESQVRILPQSEKVWLDGELLKRGVSQDYVIDYQTGQLTFTPRRPITSDSRIMVEFQYANEDFRRSLSGAVLRLPRLGGFGLAGGYFTEGDDPDRPLSISLNQDQRNLLSLAGDDTSKLWVDGGSASDSGDYIYQDSIYVYVGTGGNYRVSFTRVGLGNGDYRYDPILGGYRYVGPGQGEYIARIKLPRPEKQQALSLVADYDGSGLRAEIEAARSDRDRNLLSDRDDGDNSGTAFRYDLSWSRDSLPWGGFKIASRAWQTGENFWNGAVAPQPDLYQEWGLRGWRDLKEVDQLDGLRYQQHRAEYRPWGSLSLGGGYGRLSLARERSLISSQGWLTLKPSSNIENTYVMQHIRLGGPWFVGPWNRGQRNEHRLSSSWSWRRFRLQTGGRAAEDLRQQGAADLGTRAWDCWAGIDGSLSRTRWATKYQREEELLKDSASGRWSGAWYANSWRNQIQLFLPSSEISLEHSSRSKRMRPGMAGTGSDAHLGLVRLDLKPWNQMVNLNTEYSLSLSLARERLEQYFKVPDGTGNYNYDPGTGSFYPDTSGNYIRQLIDQGDSKRTVDVGLKTTAGFDPSVGRTLAWWSKLKFEVSALAAIKSFRPITPKLLGFAPSRLWDRQGNFSSGLDLAADVWYRTEPWNHHLRYRWVRSDDNQSSQRHQSQQGQERNWEASTQLDPLTRLSLRGRWDINIRQTLEQGPESRIEPQSLGFELWRQIERDLEIGALGSALWEKIERQYSWQSAFQARFREYSPEINVLKYWGASGSLRLSLGAIKRTADRDQTSMPAEYRLTRPLGWTGFWRAQYDYRMNRNVIITASYDGRSEPGRKMKHNGRMEVRAYF